MKKKKLIIWGVIVVIAIALIFMLIQGNKQELILNTTTVKNVTIETTVMATGYIQPVEEVEVGTQVSGVIEKIYVDYNSHVTAGQLLAELDKSTLEEKLAQANASLISARSDSSYAQQNYDRVKQLHDVKAATDVSLEEAVNRLEQAKMSLKNAKANTNQAKVNLDYAYIYSPINGVILDRQVNVGQTVAASFNTPTLFTIAEDLTKMQVEVDVDEADIGLVKVGQKSTFTVDAYSDDIFNGTVQQIRLQPTVTSNVVTYTVIVEAPNPEEKLYPGMTANITIQINSESGLSVPLEAMNFHITEEVAKHLHGKQANLPQDANLKQQSPEMQNTPAISSNGNKNRHTSVWIKKGDNLEQRNIQTGMSNGINAIVKSGLNEGDEVVLSASIAKKGEKKKATSIMPGPPR